MSALKNIISTSILVLKFLLASYLVTFPSHSWARSGGTGGAISEVIDQMIPGHPAVHAVAPFFGSSSGSGASIAVYTRCDPPGEVNRKTGACQINGSSGESVEQCRGIKKSQVTGRFECWKQNGHFTLIDSSGKRDADFDSSGNDQNQFKSINRVHGPDTQDEKPEHYQVRDGTHSSPGLINSKGESLIPSGTTNCHSFSSTDGKNIACLNSNGKVQDEVSASSLRDSKKALGMEDIADNFAIDLCAVSLQRANSSKSKKPKQESQARDTSLLSSAKRLISSGKRLISSGEQFNFSKSGDPIKISLKETENYGKKCVVDKRECDQILVKEKTVECVSFFPSKQIKEIRNNEEQILDLRANFIKTEVLGLDKDVNSATIDDVLKKSRGHESLLKIKGSISEIFKDHKTRSGYQPKNQQYTH